MCYFLIHENLNKDTWYSNLMKQVMSIVIVQIFWILTGNVRSFTRMLFEPHYAQISHMNEKNADKDAYEEV